MSQALIGINLRSTANGGYTRVRRTEGLLRSVIGAVVQGTRRCENPSLGGHWLLGLVQFFKGP
jgi:hypothetical protein